MAPTGSVVLDGHADTRADGPGASFRLADLRPGDLVLLEAASARLSYVVTAVRSHPKAQLPASTFDTRGPSRLC